MSREMEKIHKKVKEGLPGSDWSPFKSMDHLPPEHSDIVIVGGGIMGWSVAYWLKKMLTKQKAYNVLVVERDPTVSYISGEGCQQTHIDRPGSYSVITFSDRAPSGDPLLY